ncbi:SulP family inorganic anion transporter [Vibrio diazotrophicus]|uniref:SulP family inorganic anion transporter n=1 Tax=Vibrio diazotrophicus TaxID=685 RepID=UPI000C9EA3D3|nr:SulP family inorganic anion transporter [Vibrio diazotrophicus]PNH93411.1 sodium-independent anion transporter [Vibrio diazotrophicus]
MSGRFLTVLVRCFPFIAWLPQVKMDVVKADLLAGLTGAVIVMPQGVAYAMIAGLPPEYGLYTAIIPAILAALFGSSNHLISGPTAALSVIVFSTISQFADTGTPFYIQLCLTLTFCAGIVQLLMGVMRIGAVVNFVSHSVVIGFTAGAAVVITVSQLRHVLGLDYSSANTAIENLWLVLLHLHQVQVFSLLIALITIASCIAAKRLLPAIPNMLVAMLASVLLALLLTQIGIHIDYVDQIQSSTLQLSAPELDSAIIGELSGGILAVALLGLVEAISIGRAVALKSKQRIDSNQEFIGQGISNLVGAFFSCYMSSGSFTRSGVNFSSGARTPLAAVFAGLILLLLMPVMAEYVSYIPLAGMGGILLVVAYNLVDIPYIRSIIQQDKKESAVLMTTFVAAIVLHLELSIYVGIMMSMFFYLRRTSRPVVDKVTPTELDIDEASFPDTQIVRINGSIYFGCVEHLHRELDSIKAQRLIILGKGINFIDHLGVQMLAELSTQGNREIYFCHFKANAKQALLHGSSVFKETHFSERLMPLLAGWRIDVH